MTKSKNFYIIIVVLGIIASTTPCLSQIVSSDDFLSASYFNNWSSYTWDGVYDSDFHLAIDDDLMKKDWNNLNPNRKIKSIEIDLYKAQDKFGTITKGEQIYRNPIPFERDKYFSKNGKISSEKWQNYTFTYNYNEQGNLTEVSWLAAAELLYKVLFIYNSDDIIEERIYGGQGGNLTSIVQIDYLSKGLIKEIKLFGQDGKLINKISQDYDAKSKITEIRFTKRSDNKDILEQSRRLKYSKKNSMVSEIVLRDRTKSGKYAITKVNYSYDDIGNMVRKETDFGYGVETKIYFYDKNGNVIKFNEVYSEFSDIKNERSETFNYTYDNNNNWIKLIKYVNNLPKYLVEREIEYYED